MCDFFFFQAEDGIRDRDVTGVQTCALPISRRRAAGRRPGCPSVGRALWSESRRRPRKGAAAPATRERAPLQTPELAAVRSGPAYESETLGSAASPVQPRRSFQEATARSAALPSTGIGIPPEITAGVQLDLVTARPRTVSVSTPLCAASPPLV